MKTLDARQRAMLLDMGVRVWCAAQNPPRIAASGNSASDAPACADAPTLHPSPAVPPPVRADLQAPSSAPRALESHASVQAPRLLYPEADPSKAPIALGTGWMIVAESFADGDPLAKTAERLFRNMLQALGLHHHPRVLLCSVEPQTLRTESSGWPSATADIARYVESIAPSVVVLMGRTAVLAALGRSDPLGKLRGAALAIAGAPTVVTFGPHFLLRNPESKSAAWADLCRARALAGPCAGAPMP